MSSISREGPSLPKKRKYTEEVQSATVPNSRESCANSNDEIQGSFRKTPSTTMVLRKPVDDHVQSDLEEDDEEDDDDPDSAFGSEDEQENQMSKQMEIAEALTQKRANVFIRDSSSTSSSDDALEKVMVKLHSKKELPQWTHADIQDTPAATGPSMSTAEAALILVGMAGESTEDKSRGTQGESPNTSVPPSTSTTTPDETDAEVEKLAIALAGSFDLGVPANLQSQEGWQGPKDERKYWRNKLSQKIKTIWPDADKEATFISDPRLFSGPMGFVLHLSNSPALHPRCDMTCDHNKFFPQEPELGKYRRISIYGSIRFDIQMTLETRLWKITNGYMDILRNAAGGSCPQDLLALDLVHPVYEGDQVRLHTMRQNVEKMWDLRHLEKDTRENLHTLELGGKEWIVTCGFDTFRIRLIKQIDEIQ